MSLKVSNQALKMDSAHHFIMKPDKNHIFSLRELFHCILSRPTTPRIGLWEAFLTQIFVKFWLAGRRYLHTIFCFTKIAFETFILCQINHFAKKKKSYLGNSYGNWSILQCQTISWAFTGLKCIVCKSRCKSLENTTCLHSFGFLKLKMLKLKFLEEGCSELSGSEEFGFQKSDRQRAKSNNC